MSLITAVRLLFSCIHYRVMFTSYYLWHKWDRFSFLSRQPTGSTAIRARAPASEAHHHHCVTSPSAFQMQQGRKEGRLFPACQETALTGHWAKASQRSYPGCVCVIFQRRGVWIKVRVWAPEDNKEHWDRHWWSLPHWLQQHLPSTHTLPATQSPLQRLRTGCQRWITPRSNSHASFHTFKNSLSGSAPDFLAARLWILKTKVSGSDCDRLPWTKPPMPIITVADIIGS